MFVVRSSVRPRRTAPAELAARRDECLDIGEASSEVDDARSERGSPVVQLRVRDERSAPPHGDRQVEEAFADPPPCRIVEVEIDLGQVGPHDRGGHRQDQLGSAHIELERDGDVPFERVADG